MGNNCQCPALYNPDGQIQTQKVYIPNHDPDSLRKFLQSLIKMQNGFQQVSLCQPFCYIKQQYIDNSKDKPIIWKTTYPSNFYIWRIGQRIQEREAVFQGKVGIFFISQSENKNNLSQNNKQIKEQEISNFYCGKINEYQAFDDNGIYINKDNSKYQGSIQHSKASGYGVYTNYQYKYSYDGHWKNNKPNGKGIQKYNDTIYQGQFFNGIRHGKGKYIVKIDNHQTLYIGQFVNGVFDGKGILQDNNFKYQGQFQNGLKNGYGVWQNKKTHQKYMGNFQNGKKDGKGRYIFSDRSIYEDGQGSIKKQCQIIKGIWVDGKNIVFKRLTNNDKQ